MRTDRNALAILRTWFQHACLKSTYLHIDGHEERIVGILEGEVRSIYFEHLRYIKKG